MMDSIIWLSLIDMRSSGTGTPQGKIWSLASISRVCSTQWSRMTQRIGSRWKRFLNTLGWPGVCLQRLNMKCLKTWAGGNWSWWSQALSQKPRMTSLWWKKNKLSQLTRTNPVAKVNPKGLKLPTVFWSNAGYYSWDLYPRSQCYF